MPSQKSKEPRPRAYQAECVESIFAQWRQGFRSTLAVLATGLGKTFVFATVARKFPQHRGRVLVLEHKDELIRQAVDKLRWICPDDMVEVEQGKRRAARNRHAFADSTGKRRALSRIVVASKDTLWREHRLRTFEPDEFGLIVIDECHRWTEFNKTYHSIVQRFPGASILGTTATAYRADKVALGFESIAYQYPIAPAIRDGWLVKPIQQFATVDGYDLDKLTRPANGKDWNPVELDELVRQERPEQSMSAQIVYYATTEAAKRGRRRPLSTLVFAASVEHAEDLAAILNRRHQRDGTGKAASVSGRDGSDDDGRRRRVFEAFESGEITYLTNYNIATEGYDNPSIEMIFMGRAVRFPGLLAQMIGRGTRPLDSIVERLNDAADADERRRIIAESDKPYVLVVDPVGSTGVHDLAADVIDVLGAEYGSDVIKEAKLAAMRGDGRFETTEGLEAAKERIEQAKAQEYLKRVDFILDCSFRDKLVDPFSDYEGGAPAARINTAAAMRPISVGQITMLRSLGIKEPEIAKLRTSGAAQALIREGLARRKAGLCSINQRRALERFGVDASAMTKAQASRRLDEIKANGWRPLREPGEEG